MGCLEVVNPQEEAHAPARLVADDRTLVVAVCAGEEDPRLRTRRPNDNPAL
jgi:hypothetical protein